MTHVDHSAPHDEGDDLELGTSAGSGQANAALAPTLLVVALGGALGSVGRWLVGLMLPHTAGGFPWSTWWVNVTGAFVAGVAATLVARHPSPHPLLRPFLVVGVLGGWTTFSTYALDALHQLQTGHAGTAAAYVGGTLVVGLAAALVGVLLGHGAADRTALDRRRA